MGQCRAAVLLSCTESCSANASHCVRVQGCGVVLARLQARQQQLRELLANMLAAQQKLLALEGQTASQVSISLCVLHRSALHCQAAAQQQLRELHAVMMHSAAPAGSRPSDCLEYAHLFWPAHLRFCR